MNIPLRRTLFSSLALRVLLTSALFVIIPLIFYAGIIYKRDYNEKVRDVFQEMTIFQKDQITYLLQLEEGTLNVLEIFKQLSPFIDNQKSLDTVLADFAYKGKLSAFFHLNEDMVCVSSTLPAYVNKALFTLDHVEKGVFIAEDPVLGYSLFITLPLVENGHLMGVLGASIDLDFLLETLMKLRHIYQSNLSIIALDGTIIASSDKTRIGKRLLDTKILQVQSSENTIAVKHVDGIPHGFRFHLDGEDRFMTFARIPYTDMDLSLSIPTDIVLTKLYSALTELSILLACILIIGGMATYLLTLRFAKPLNTLIHVMDQVSEGHLETRFTKDSLGFELNYLGERFNQMILSLTNYMEEVQRERTTKETYKKELQIGHEIQHSILPEGAIQFPGLTTSVYFQAAREVAGDFYDWLVKDDHLLLAVADGVGKGISACLYSFDLRSILRSFGSLSNDLAHVARQTNHIFCQDTKDTGNFVTAFLALYQAPTKTLHCVNCGHNYPFIRRADGSVERLELHGLAFGIDHFDSVDVRSVPLSSGDLVFLYTDGLTDAQNTARHLFGEKRVIELLKKSSDPKELQDLILRELSLFTEGEEPFDDITFLVFRVD